MSRAYSRISLLEERVIDTCRRLDCLAEFCTFTEYYTDLGRVPEHWRANVDLLQLLKALYP